MPFYREKRIGRKEWVNQFVILSSNILFIYFLEEQHFIVIFHWECVFLFTSFTYDLFFPSFFYWYMLCYEKITNFFDSFFNFL